VVPAGTPFAVRAFGGKEDLVSHLEAELAARRGALESGRLGCVVLIDLDRRAGEGCRELKGRLEAAAARAGVRTRANRGPGGRYGVVTRIAIDELESWFLGDPAAVTAAYPRVPGDIGSRRTLRDPEAVPDGASEILHRLIWTANGRRTGKVSRAAMIGAHMDPDRNRAPSFHAFIEAVRAIASP
jgi:hypothetical protein